jgi:serine/threonine protein kinase
MNRSIPEGTFIDGKYRIIRMLGEVYLAEDNLLKSNHVAIKSLKMNDSDREKIFVREMQFLSDLDHLNIVHFFHYFSEYDTLFLNTGRRF